jgi:RNA polymerase sigma-70 factor, ECF subfamily
VTEVWGSFGEFMRRATGYGPFPFQRRVAEVGLPELLRSYSGEGRFESWLQRIVVRRALALMRRPLWKRHLPLAVAAGPALEVRPEAVVERTTLEQALARLPVKYRAVFVLHQVQGYSHQEIAELLGIQRSLSEKRLYRARNLLRRLLRSP